MRKVKEFTPAKKLTKDGLKECIWCKNEYPPTTEFFHLSTVRGKKYLKSYCIKCDNRRASEYSRKRRANPATDRILLENKRIDYHLRHPDARTHPGALKYPEFDRDYLVPATPFIEFLKQDSAGLDESLLRKIITGERTQIYLSTADKIATALNLPLNSYLPEHLTHSATV